MAFRRQVEFEQQEALLYHPGQRVELKQRPGVIDTIAEYDPMMVPPIWLVNDPQPRYPEELNLLSKPLRDWFGASSYPKVGAPACRLGDRTREKVLV